MSGQIVTKPNPLVMMATRLNTDAESLRITLKETVFRGATDSEFRALIIISNEYELNPLLKEIYAFKKKEGAGVQAVVGVDGWARIINRQKQLDGVEFEDFEHEDGAPNKITCVISVKGRKKPVKVTERFKECYRKTDPWEQMPWRMLRHKALIQCARYAFGISGIVDEDEARDIKPANVKEIPRRFVYKPNFTAETEPKIKAREEAKDTAPFGDKSVPAGASGDDGANVTPKGASVAPDEITKTDEEIWEES